MGLKYFLEYTADNSMKSICVKYVTSVSHAFDSAAADPLVDISCGQ